MSSKLFNKDRYIFSTRKNKKEVLDEKALASGVNLFRKKLKEYKISYRALYSKKPNIERKNLILNIAKHITEREELIKSFKKEKRIPIIDVGFETRVKESFLEEWNAYIVAYVILFSDRRLSEVAKYLKIEYREIDELSLVPVVDNSEDNLIKGLGIEVVNFKQKVFAMTSQGEFIRIKDNRSWRIGDEVVGKESKSINKRTVPLLIWGSALVSVCIIISLIYNYPSSTILIRGNGEIKLEVNGLNKVVSAYSEYNSERKLLKDIHLKNKSTDKVIYEILVYCEENNMIPKNKTFNIIVSGKPLNLDNLKETKRFLTSEENKKIGITIVTNNAGEETTIK